MNLALPVVMLVVGLALGAGAAWLVFRLQAAHAYDRGKSEADTELATLNERLAGRQQIIDEQIAKIRSLEQQLAERQTAEANLKASLVQMKTRLEQEQAAVQKERALLDEARQKLADAFKALAADALKSNNQSFIDLAKATMETFQQSAKGDLEKRQQAIEEMVKPVKESLEKVDAKIQDIEKARTGAYEGLRAQVSALLETEKELRCQTSNLVTALRRPQVRGRWGEIQLQRVVEMAGMLEYCDFYTQQSTDTEEGRLRPDLLVRLPGVKNIVVDAKAPLSAYLEAIEARDDETRTLKLREHARQVRSHISVLNSKLYFRQFDPAPEFVVLFLPGEVFFSAALEQDPELIELGVQQNVIIATPTTLIALLRAVAYGWRQERLAQDAQKISELGQDLYRRLATMGDYLSRLGKGLHAANDAYNKAVASLETRVLVSARKFKDYGISDSSDKIEELQPLETTVRALQAPELLASSQDGDG